MPTGAEEENMSVWGVMELFRRGEVGMEDEAARREKQSLLKDIPLTLCVPTVKQIESFPGKLTFPRSSRESQP